MNAFAMMAIGNKKIIIFVSSVIINGYIIFLILQKNSLTCNGPDYNNCLSCDSNNFRSINISTNTCNCDDGYGNEDENSVC